ncbi:hypothetical protein AVEN_244113-1 [Araneus ventricosus]|uniref:Uncharacterized protein n=1 Tax=Araneus ventricosus TaxID=182803 RepID=A0A4Y2N4I2_ARAVE|nr:hypothetical protein AVEN_244113-1 [Araneus ventricosus]
MPLNPTVTVEMDFWLVLRGDLILAFRNIHVQRRTLIIHIQLDIILQSWSNAEVRSFFLRRTHSRFAFPESPVEGADLTNTKPWSTSFTKLTNLPTDEIYQKYAIFDKMNLPINDSLLRKKRKFVGEEGW